MTDDVWDRLAEQDRDLDAAERAEVESRKKLGTRIKNERIRRRWTAEKTAQLAGIAHKTYQRIEQGKTVRALSLQSVETLFQSDTQVDSTATSGPRVSVDAFVGSVPFFTLDELERIRAAVNTAIAIRSGATT